MAIGEIIILKDGNPINGKILTKEFVLKTSFGQIKLEKKNIMTIHYKNPPQFLSDEVQLDAMTQLEGDLLPNVITVHIDAINQDVQINKSDIHTIIFFTGRQTEISSKSRKLIARLEKE